MRSSVDRADMTRQIGVGGRPSRSGSAPPGIIARGRNVQDAGHCTNRIHGLVRAHEPVNPFGLAFSPARLASPKWKSTARSARTHAPTPRACVQIAPDRPSVAGTPADKQFDNAASDTSKT